MTVDIEKIKTELGTAICGGYSYNPKDEIYCDDCKAISNIIDHLAASYILVPTQQPLPDHDNHHNALKCPYCNPKQNLIEVPAGWMLVPIEPTKEMVQAGFNAFHHGDGDMKWERSVYKAMLSAAPSKEKE